MSTQTLASQHGHVSRAAATCAAPVEAMRPTLSLHAYPTQIQPSLVAESNEFDGWNLTGKRPRVALT